MNISIVVPVYNSKKSLDALVQKIAEVALSKQWEYELLLVDDGSRDGSFDRIKDLASKNSRIKGFRLSKNFGHQAAIRTALQHCSGEYIAVLDDDLQDPPEVLDQLFKKLDEGYDVAYGIRKKRKEGILKKLLYFLFYRLLKVMSNIKIPLDSGDFAAMKKSVVEVMLQMNEKTIFLRGQRAWIGFKQVGVPYERQARKEGKSGHSFRKLLSIAIDGIFSFSRLPVRIISVAGFFGLLTAVGYSMFLAYHYFVEGIEVRGFTTLVALVSLFSSLILICLGIIGDYVIRIYDEVRNRPFSIVAEKTF